MPCPPRARNIILAERFPGIGGPWNVEDVDAERILPYLEALGVEAQAHSDRAGLSSDAVSVELG